MSNPDEIVCEDAQEFIDMCLSKLGLGVRCGLKPGERVTRAGFSVVYRPSPPSRCPRCGSSDRNTYVEMSMRDFKAPCFGAGDYHPWHAAGLSYTTAHFRDPIGTPPPRDEAREAFEKWAEDKKFSPDGWWTASMAFLAGRASVKP